MRGTRFIPFSSALCREAHLHAADSTSFQIAFPINNINTGITPLYICAMADKIITTACGFAKRIHICSGKRETIKQTWSDYEKNKTPQILFLKRDKSLLKAGFPSK
jgi:hypothetical protein